ncbi:peptidoglycan editing factor PgeF [Aquisediminimonas sediminicola]|uniref:peptidoglycan editing factor PgeF n=1 Tax=Alteraquisediminimonas sediminicola TaxID=2676787 RepID=UPI001C8E6F6A|nr:peptidoglycan editing factor PgeF [Aquisediminimonas sediminicola]
MSDTPAPPFIQSPVFGGLPHGFFGRQGGVSTGQYASLNIGPGSDDVPADIAENRHRIREAILPGGELVTLYQIHSADVVTVTAPIAHDARPEADALVTNTPGLLLGILTADCVPVLFADLDAGVIGAAHAGWKGAIHGVTDNTIAAMEALGADRSRIVAALGPCIARASYEVSDAFALPFLEQNPAHEQFFTDARRKGHLMFDIAGYVLARLAAAGIRKAEWVGIDTCADEQGYFSYRRSTLRGEPGYGRQMSVIGLPVTG